MLRFTCALLTALALTGTARASATVIYAAPDALAANVVCTTPQAPCTFLSALGLAGSGDTVVLAPGSYASAGRATSAGVEIRGPGANAARLTLSSPLDLASSAVVSGFTLVTPGSSGLIARGLNSVTGVDVRAHGSACAVTGLPVSIQDSACVNLDYSASESGVLMNNPGGNGPLTLRNTTLYGGFSGISLIESGGRSVIMQNTVVGSPSAQCPIAFGRGNGDKNARVQLSTVFSAYPFISDSCHHSATSDTELLTLSEDHHVAGVATFVGGGEPTASSSMRPKAGAITINAGLDMDLMGELDLAGLPRAVDGRTDIGAYEFVPPPTLTGIGASTVTTTGAAITATADGHGVATASTVLYGIADVNEHQTGLVMLPRAAAAQALRVPLDGLQPGTTYKYQLCTGAFDGGSDALTCAPEAAFRTAAPVTPDPTPVTPDPTPVTPDPTPQTPAPSGPTGVAGPVASTPSPGPSAPLLAPPAPALPGPAPVRIPGIAELVSAPSTKRCVSRRRFTIRLRVPAGVAVRSATVTVNGKTVATRRGRTYTAAIDLRNLPKAAFTVKISVTLQGGKVRSSTRTYRTCAARR